MGHISYPDGEGSADVTYDDGVGGSGQRESVVHTASGTELYQATFEYDGLGYLERETLRTQGETLVAGYRSDLLGRMRRIDYPEAGTAIEYRYDGQNRAAYVKSVCTGALSGAGCLHPNLDYVKSLSYSRGRLTKMVTPAGTLDRGYAPEGEIKSIRFQSTPGVEEVDFQYLYNQTTGDLLWVYDYRDDKSGDGIDMTSGFAYDARRRLKQWDVGASGPSYYFSYDELGNLIGRGTSSPSGQDQFYDPVKPHQLTSRVGVPGSYQYDGDGNLTVRPTESGTTQHLTYDSQNRLTKVGTQAGAGNVAQYGYDIDGRRIFTVGADGKTRILLGDLFEFEKGASQGVGRSTSVIFVNGERVAVRVVEEGNLRTEQEGLPGPSPPFDPWAPFAVLVLSAGAWVVFRFGIAGAVARRPLRSAFSLVVAGALVAYPAGGGTPPPTGDTGGVRRWFVTDHLGSASVVLDAGGNVVTRQQFDPYGRLFNPPETDPERQIFAGQRLEANSGLYDFKARWYDPETGHFLSPDPVLAALEDPQTHNAYAYARGNPIVFVDPTGLSACFATDLVDAVPGCSNHTNLNSGPGIPVGGGDSGGVGFSPGQDIFGGRPGPGSISSLVGSSSSNPGLGSVLQSVLGIDVSKPASGPQRSGEHRRNDGGRCGELCLLCSRLERPSHRCRGGCAAVRR